MIADFGEIENPRDGRAPPIKRPKPSSWRGADADHDQRAVGGIGFDAA